MENANSVETALPAEKVVDDTEKDKASEEFTKLKSVIEESTQKIIEEFRKSSTENARLLEEKSVLSAKLTAASAELSASKAENDKLRQKLSEISAQLVKTEETLRHCESLKSILEQKLADTEQKLTNVQQMNDTMTVKTRSAFAESIKNTMKMSYEDYQEYSNAPCNEENYETMQAIIKGIFRALSSNGIKFTEE